MNTVYGIVSDELGHAFSARTAWSTPAGQVLAVQESEIPVDRDHSGIACGKVIYLERRNGNLWAVAEVADDVTSAVDVKVGTEIRSVETPLYWSPERIGGPEFGIVITSLSLTSSPARIAPRPVTFRQGDASRAAGKSAERAEQGLLQRAAEYDLRRHGTPIVVQGQPRQKPAPQLEAASSRQLIEVRSATVAELHTSRRQLDLIISPAEVPATIQERGGKQFTEIFAHGAFAGCETDPGKVRVNRDHVRERVMGKAISLDPWSEEGLTGTVRLARVADADEALALVEDGLLGVSAGFGVDRGGDEWRHGGQLRRVKRAVLDHIALVPVPAYESAAVLAVRAAAC